MALGQLPDDEWEVLGDDSNSDEDEYEVIEEPSPKPIPKPEPVQPILSVQEESVSPVIPIKKPSFWDRINEPLTDAPTRAGKFLASKMDQPTLDSSPTGNDSWSDTLKKMNAMVKGFGAGATEGLGDLATRMTSPLELGMALASGGASMARRGGLMGLSRGLEAANMLASGAETIHGAGEVIRPDATLSEKLSGGVEAGLGALGVKHSLPNLKRVAKATPASLPTKLAAETPELPDLSIGKQPVSIDNTVDDMLDEALANRPAPVQPPVQQKPKIKVKYNPQTNSLEPDLSDELTAKLTKSVRTGEPVPQNERISPDTEIDIDDLVQDNFDFNKPTSDYKPTTPFAAKSLDKNSALDLVEGRQNELPGARVADDGVRAKGEAGDLTNASQSELPGNIREPKPDEFQPWGKPEKELPKPTKTQEVLGLSKALQSIFDLSFPLRQGRTLIHTKGWWKAWGDSIRSGKSKEMYDGVMQSIGERPNFRGKITRDAEGNIKSVGKSLAQEAGLEITDIPTKREEALGSALAEKIPGIGKIVGASNRAYNAFANKLRADVFDDLIEKNPHAKTDLTVAKAIAAYVNNASGRGDLGKLEPIANTLNNVLFSPRFAKSRFHMMNPRNLLFSKPEVRNEYIKSAASMAGSWITVAKLAEYAGAQVSWDPESSEFGKIKINNTRIDPGAGFQQPLVLMYRLMKGTGQKIFGYGGRYDKSPFVTGAGDLGNFLEGKLAPNARFGWNLFNADKNKPFETGDQSMKLVTPIFLQGLSELAQEDPEMAWLAGLDFLGVGSNTYKDKNDWKKPTRLLPEGLFPRKSDLTFPLKRPPKF